jgi:small subunit ribosomal protein S1
LECEVHAIRGFIPVSQISLFRVDDLEQFVGEKFTCIVTEANPARGNLVLSRRAVLEREKAEQKEKLLQSLEVGQTREGVVRNIRDFGAFVDLGGVDGLIHISQLSWDRVAHPSEVLEEGQKIKVRIDKIDETTGKIGLSYRDLLEHPWDHVREKYPENSLVTGTVSKIMDFGAFVRLEAGVEGLVHISELAHHRVVRVGNVVQEGEVVTVKVLSVDTEAQRMSLSIKAAQAQPEEPAAPDAAEETEEPPREKAVKPYSGTLRGGTNRKTGGDQFGLKW